MSGFVHLHLHSEYSLLDGACRIKDIPARALECGHTSVAITDHGCMYGVIAFYNECKKNGIKPIIGCEVYVASGSRFERGVSKDLSKYNHLVLLCKNEIGYKNLMYMVSKGYTEGFLRKSVVRDPLDRVNTGDNTPAMIYYDLVPGDKVEITVAPKGFGSENMSQIKMLKPSDGELGVKDFVVKVVEEAGPNPCPPIVVGVGIGGTFDKAAFLAKKALMRSVDEHNENPYYAAMEQELLERINALGIGPQGFGGKTTALAVNIEHCPTHIAGLPVAVNINCHVTRHKTEVL